LAGLVAVSGKFEFSLGLLEVAKRGLNISLGLIQFAARLPG
jgi:hypothetical protein